jgi:hypothetical protein
MVPSDADADAGPTHLREARDGYVEFVGSWESAASFSFAEALFLASTAFRPMVIFTT